MARPRKEVRSISLDAKSNSLESRIDVEQSHLMRNQIHLKEA